MVSVNRSRGDRHRAALRWSIVHFVSIQKSEAAGRRTAVGRLPHWATSARPSTEAAPELRLRLGRVDRRW